MPCTLYDRVHRINEHIAIKIPTVGELLENEDAYYDAVTAIIATPYEMMVQLDDIGITFTDITDFDLFMLLFPKIQEMDTHNIFVDLDLSGFLPAENPENKTIFLINESTGAVIDRAIHDQVCTFLREMLCIPRDDKTPGNKAALEYMIRRARIKMNRKKGKKRESQLEKLIISLVNTAEFPYNYETVRDITIYQFYASLKQVSRKVRFDKTMIGVYAGTVKADELEQDEKTWVMI